MKAGLLAAILALLTAASTAVIFIDDATFWERLAGLSTTSLFGWGFALALSRLFDRRAALVIDAWGIRDRRMKINAPWSSIRGTRVWTQEFDAAKATWVVLDVDAVDAVRALTPLWTRLRRATLERWGRPPVALNLQGLNATAEEVLAAISGFSDANAVEAAISQRARQSHQDGIARRSRD
jgi:hypothetical protein